MEGLWVLILVSVTLTPIQMWDKQSCVTALENVKPMKAYCLSARTGELIEQKDESQ